MHAALHKALACGSYKLLSTPHSISCKSSLRRFHSLRHLQRSHLQQKPLCGASSKPLAIAFAVSPFGPENFDGLEIPWGMSTESKQLLLRPNPGGLRRTPSGSFLHLSL